MDGTVVVYVVKYSESDSKFKGEVVKGVYSTYEKALNKANKLADGNLNDMVTDMMYLNWWWSWEMSIGIEKIILDEDIG